MEARHDPVDTRVNIIVPNGVRGSSYEVCRGHALKLALPRLHKRPEQLLQQVEEVALGETGQLRALQQCQRHSASPRPRHSHHEYGNLFGELVKPAHVERKWTLRRVVSQGYSERAYLDLYSIVELCHEPQGYGSAAFA